MTERTWGKKIAHAKHASLHVIGRDLLKAGSLEGAFAAGYKITTSENNFS
jgi:hypothetical protein